YQPVNVSVFFRPRSRSSNPGSSTGLAASAGMIRTIPPIFRPRAASTNCSRTLTFASPPTPTSAPATSTSKQPPANANLRMSNLRDSSGYHTARTFPLLLLPDPRDVLPYGLVFQKQLPRVVFLGEFFFVRDQVVDAMMTLLADHQGALAHLHLAEAI